MNISLGLLLYSIFCSVIIDVSCGDANGFNHDQDYLDNTLGSNNETQYDESVNEIDVDETFEGNNKSSSCITDCQCPPSKSDQFCLSEECIMAASTILSSLDRSIDPCQDFYQYACGGWIQQSLMQNTDRFSVIDKKNQNVIAKVLGANKESIHDANDQTAETKAKRFYHSCLSEGNDQDKANLLDLQNVIDFVGGWNLTGTWNQTYDMQKKTEMIHNLLGLNVLFTWGVIEYNNSYKLAIIAGGWNDALIVEESEREEYLKVMTMYTILLAQALEDTIEVNLRYPFDPQSRDSDSLNNSISIVLEYEEISNQSQYSYDYDFWNTSETISSTSNTSDFDLSKIMYALNPYNWISSGDEGQSQKEDRNQTDGDLVIETVDANENNSSTQDQDAEYQSDIHKLSADDIKNLANDESLAKILDRTKKIEMVMSDIIDFEHKLGNITVKPANSKNLKPFKISQLNSEFPFLDWKRFFTEAVSISSKFNKENSPLSDDSPDPELEVMVQAEFLEGVNQLVKEYQASPWGKQVMNDYMIWRILASFFPDRPQEKSQREERCVKETEELFSASVTAMFIKSNGIGHSEKVVKEVDMMVSIMQKAFADNLKDLPWMSANSLKSAERKLEHMVDLIGYPKFVLNSTWMNNLYKNVEVSSEDYLMNLVTHRSFLRHVEIEEFFRPYARGKWNEFSHMANIATVNAYYNQATNTMVVPIGMLQPPLYWNRPKSLTFGAFGIVVAHEITHAFDDEGIMFDALGNFQPVYDNKTIKAFHEASDCIRKQYSSFTLNNELRVDGNITLGENIADHGGLKIAEKAYTDWLRKNAYKDSSLPAVDFTNEQLFYLGYALPWCAVHSDNTLRTHILKDEHAPDRFRVMGPLMNSDSFANAWNCPKGTVMNPNDKCRIW